MGPRVRHHREESRRSGYDSLGLALGGKERSDVAGVMMSVVVAKGFFDGERQPRPDFIASRTNSHELATNRNAARCLGERQQRRFTD